MNIGSNSATPRGLVRRSAEHEHLEMLEPRIVLDGEWSAMEGAGVYASVDAGDFLTVTTISIDDRPIAFEQADGGPDDGGSQVWDQIDLLRADDGLSNGVNADTLGRHSLAIHDGRMIIGTPNDNFGAGSAAVFELDPRGVWVFDTVLTGPGLAAGAGFGWSVDMHGNTAVIGTRSGNIAYVFRDQGGWTLEKSLTPTVESENARFGFSVAIHGSVIAVGAPGEEMLDDDASATSGAVYIYELMGHGWDLASRIDAPEDAADSEFGFAVDVHSSNVIVGAWMDDDMGESSGSVFGIGGYGDFQWVIESKLTPSELSPGARFGYDVATGGSRAVAIALGADDDSNASWAEVFHRSGARWNAEVVLADPEYRSVDFHGGRIVLGSAFGAGSALVYQMDATGQWRVETSLMPSEEAGASGVGFDVAMHGGTVILGGLIMDSADNEDPTAVNAAAWVFRGPNDTGDDDSGKEWIVRGLGELPLIGDPVSDVQTWTDVKDGQTYAVVATTEGLLLFTRADDRSAWTMRNLTTELDDAEKIVGQIEVFATNGSRVLIVGYAADGALLLYRQPNTGEPGNWDWDFANLTDLHLTPQGLETPKFVGNISGFATSWDALNITGLDSQGRVRAVWIGPGMDRWTTADLSANAGTPRLRAGNLAAFTTSWGAINLAGVDEDGNLVVTWWVPGFERWVISDFNTLFGGAKLEPDSLTAYTTEWGGLNIVGRDARGDVVVYWWVPGFAEDPSTDRWHIANISAEVTDAEPPQNRLRGVVTQDGQINLFGTNAGNDVVRYFWEPGDRWQFENLTHTAEPAE